MYETMIRINKEGGWGCNSKYFDQLASQHESIGKKGYRTFNTPFRHGDETPNKLVYIAHA